MKKGSLEKCDEKKGNEGEDGEVEEVRKEKGPKRSKEIQRIIN